MKYNPYIQQINKSADRRKQFNHNHRTNPAPFSSRYIQITPVRLETYKLRSHAQYRSRTFAQSIIAQRHRSLVRLCVDGRMFQIILRVCSNLSHLFPLVQSDLTNWLVRIEPEVQVRDMRETTFH